MIKIDLHAHTTHSDGTLTPTELIDRARDVGLGALAVTDHDTTENRARISSSTRPTVNNGAPGSRSGCASGIMARIVLPRGLSGAPPGRPGLNIRSRATPWVAR